MRFFGDDYAKVKFFNVGHGDAILIESYNSSSIWRCLIDGGQGNKLRDYLKELNIAKIDLLVLSHLDFDHIDGLTRFVNQPHVKILKAWLPFIPAIKRFQWMFGSRTASCVDRGTNLVELLKEKGTEIIFPLQGNFQTYHDEAIEIEVISPAKRLIDVLYAGNFKIEDLLKIPLPVTDIIENGTFDENFNQEIGFTSLDPQNLGFVSINENREFPFSNMIEISEKQKIEICQSVDNEPDWFGDHLLNDTSIVFTVKLYVNGIPYKMLFAGDQENWTYLLSNVKNIHSFDIFKLPHHGGRLYFNNENYPNEVLRHILPKFTVISASETGRHKLPHEKTIDACVNFSENIFVTMNEFPDFLSKYTFDNGHYISSKIKIEENVEIPFDLSNIQGAEFLLTSESIKSNKAPIRTGKLTPQPIVQFYTIIQKELLNGTKARKNTNFEAIEKVLLSLKKLRTRPNGNSFRYYIDFKKEQKPLVLKEIRTLLAAYKIDLYDSEILEAMREGLKYGKIINCKNDNNRREELSWYLSPTNDDIRDFINCLKNYMAIILFTKRTFNLDKFSLLNEINWENIAVPYSAYSGFPTYVINEFIIPKAIPFFVENYDFYSTINPYLRVIDRYTQHEEYILCLLPKNSWNDIINFLVTQMLNVPNEKIHTYYVFREVKQKQLIEDFSFIMNINEYKLPLESIFLQFVNSLIRTFSSKKFEIDVISSSQINLLTYDKMHLFDKFIETISPIYSYNSIPWKVDMFDVIRNYKSKRHEIQSEIIGLSNEEDQKVLIDKLNSMSLNDFIKENELDDKCPWYELYEFYEKKREHIIYSSGRYVESKLNVNFEDFYCSESNENLEKRRVFYSKIVELKRNENLNNYFKFLFNEYFLIEFKLL